MVLEISFKPKKPERYIVNSGTNFGKFSSAPIQSAIEVEEEQPTLSRAASVLASLFLITSAMNMKPYDKSEEYVNTLPDNYLKNLVDTKYVVQSKPLIYYKDEDKKLKFFK